MSSNNSQIVTALEAQPRVGGPHFRNIIKSARANGSTFIPNILELTDHPLNDQSVRNCAVNSIDEDDMLQEIRVSDDRPNGFENITEELHKNPFNMYHERDGHTNDDETSQFGGGMKNAGINISNMIEWYTRTKDGRYWKVTLNVEKQKIESISELSFQPDIQMISYEEYKRYHPYEEGSTVRFYSIMPIYKSKNYQTFTDEVTKVMKDKYRGILKQKKNFRFTVNNVDISATPYIHEHPQISPLNSTANIYIMKKYNNYFIYMICIIDDKKTYYIFNNNTRKYEKVSTVKKFNKVVTEKIKDEYIYEYKENDDEDHSISVTSTFTKFADGIDLPKGNIHIERCGRHYGTIPKQAHHKEFYTNTHVSMRSKHVICELGLTHYKQIIPNPDSMVYNATMECIDTITNGFNADTTTKKFENIMDKAKKKGIDTSRVENEIDEKKKKKKNIPTPKVIANVIDPSTTYEQATTALQEQFVVEDKHKPAAQIEPVDTGTTPLDTAATEAQSGKADTVETVKTDTGKAETDKSKTVVKSNANGEEDANDTAKADSEEDAVNSDSEKSVKVKTTRRPVKGYERLIEKTEKDMWMFIAELRSKYTDAEIQEKIANATDSVIPELAKAIQVFENFS